MIEKFKIKFNLEIKPFIEHKFLEPPENFEATESKATPYKYICNKLLNFAMEENLRKDEYRVYKRSNKNPMVYELYCDDFKILLEIVFKNDEVFDSQSHLYDNMLKFITQRNKEQFSNVKFDYDWFAFNNGSLNIKTMEFINLEDIDPNTTIIARKSFNKSFNPNNTETPLLDKALLHQIKDIENF